MKKLAAGLMLLIVLVPARAQTPAETKATIEYVRALQTDEGSFLPVKDAKTGGLRATSAALRALKYLGGEPRDQAPCRKFVASCFDKDSGGFADRPGGKPDVFTTAVGVMAVVVLDMPLADYADGVVKYLSDNAKDFEDVRIAAAGLETVKKESPHNARWIAEIKKTAAADGTFGTGDGQARQTGSAAQIILRLGGKLDQQDKMLAVMKSGQRGDGGYGKPDVKGSDLETTYRLIRSLRMLKSQPDSVAKCQAFVASCRNADGGYGLAPGQPSSGPATYFAAILLHWLAEMKN